MDFCIVASPLWRHFVVWDLFQQMRQSTGGQHLRFLRELSHGTTVNKKGFIKVPDFYHLALVSTDDEADEAAIKFVWAKWIDVVSELTNARTSIWDWNLMSFDPTFFNLLVQLGNRCCLVSSNTACDKINNKLNGLLLNPIEVNAQTWFTYEDAGSPIDLQHIQNTAPAVIEYKLIKCFC